MAAVVKVLGWTMRAIALVWIVAVTLSVATAAEGFTTARELAGAIAFHAVFAATGVQLVGLSKRMSARRLETAEG